MPLTKDYQRYGPTSVYGCIAGDRSNVTWMPDKEGKYGKFAVTGCGEKIAIFNVETRQLMTVLPENSEEFSAVTCMASNKTGHNTVIAVGYLDGWVRLFDPWSGDMEINLRSHNKAITCLSFSEESGKLFCGSRDKDITIVDLESESGSRLKGHQTPITSVHSITGRNILASSAVDGIIKFWDLASNFCFKTLAGHQSEVWDLSFFDSGHQLVTATSNELNLWQIKYKDDVNEVATSNEVSVDDNDLCPILAIENLGTIDRSNSYKIEKLVTAGEHFITVMKGRKCEVFVHTQKKKKKKKPLILQWKSVSLNFPAKVVSVDGFIAKNANLKLLISMVDNSLEVRSFPLGTEALPARPVLLHQGGHRFPVHSVCISENGAFVLSVSQTEAKLFSREINQFVDTFTWPDLEDGERISVICASFAPGERHVLFGCESGALMLFDIASRQCLCNISAHEEAVSGVKLINKRGGAQEEILSAGLDKCLRMWQFKIERCLDPTLSQRPSFSLELRRHVTLPDKVTGLCTAPDGRLIAVALLDTSIRLLLADSLKVCLTLRGHSLPVRALDISSDSMRLATGSDDKTVRVWGLQFGDCQTSFHGHESAVTGVTFLPRSELVFSSSRDRTLRLWDAVKFRRVMVLRGHQAEVTALGAWRGAGAGLELEDGVSSEPRFVVSGSRDRTLRVWSELEELVVLHEEEEMAREREYAEELANEGQPLPGADSERIEHQLVSKKTLDTIKASERIMESIDECRKERAVREEWREHQRRAGPRKRKRKASEGEEGEEAPRNDKPEPPPNVLFAAYDATTEERFMLEVVSRIRRTDLERALLELPFEYVRELLPMAALWLERRWDVELGTRVTTFLLHLHHSVIASNRLLAPVVARLAKISRPAALEAKKETDFVLAGLEMILKSIDQVPEETLFDKAAKRRKKKVERYFLAE